jgi:hypothetical protein
VTRLNQFICSHSFDFVKNEAKRKKITRKIFFLQCKLHVLSFSGREQGSFRSSREQGIFWSPGTAFENSKTANIFFV